MARNPKMTKDDIRNYFVMLGEALKARGVTQEIRVLLVGGAYMVLKVGNRGTTEDIDAWLLNIPETKSGTDHPLTLAMSASINAVAKKQGITRHWFNDDVTAFIGEFLKPGKLSVYGRFGPLTVHVPTAECMLAVKIMVYRQKDRKDVQALLEKAKVKTRKKAQEILDTYVPDRRWQEYYVVGDTLDELFGEE